MTILTDSLQARAAIALRDYVQSQDEQVMAEAKRVFQEAWVALYEIELARVMREQGRLL